MHGLQGLTVCKMDVHAYFLLYIAVVIIQHKSVIFVQRCTIRCNRKILLWPHDAQLQYGHNLSAGATFPLATRRWSL